MKKEQLKTLFKFIFCSTSAWLADLCVFTIAYQLIGCHYILAKALSYLTGAIISYTMNRKITFRANTRFVSLTLAKFIAVNCVSISLSLGSMYLFNDCLGIAVWFTYFISIAFSFSANYLGNRFWVFRGVSKTTTED